MRERTRTTMLSQLHPLLILLISTIPLLTALPVLPEPEPVEPSLVLPATFSPPTTIPAFPEQSDAASACPLDLPADLLRGVSAACSASVVTGGNLRSRCCPAFAAWLYSAYSTAALTGASHPLLPAAAGADLPVLPDDSETCVAGAEQALRSRGAALPPRVNATCGVAYCYCGVRLLRLACPGPFGTSGEGRWAPRPAEGWRMENDCGERGVAGCSRCLRTLNQLKSWQGVNLRNVTGTDSKAGDKTGNDKECQLMGLTWLLSVNRTRYLPTATAVLRAFMEIGHNQAAPATCALSSDDLPLAVGSSQIEGDSPSSAITLRLFLPSLLFLYLLILSIVV